MMSNIAVSGRARTLGGLLLAAWLAACGGGAGDSAPAVCAAQSAVDRVAAWRADLACLADTLVAAHPGVYAHVTPAAFESERAAIDAAIPTLDDDAITVRMMRLAALVGDAHTQLVPSGDAALPLESYRLPEGLVVTGTDAAHTAALGGVVTAFGAVTAATAVTQLESLVADETATNRLAAVPRLAASRIVLHGLGFADSAGTLALGHDDLAGNTGTATLTPAGVTARMPDGTAVPLPLWLQNRELDYWMTTIAASRTLYIAYNRCASMASEPMAAFADRVRATIDAGGLSRIVIDLRNNPGGDSSVIAPLQQVLERATPLRQTGSYFVIVGRATASSAMMNAYSLGTKTWATTAGEPPRMRPNHYGEVRSFVLPYSRHTVQYSTRRFTLTNDPANAFPIDLPVALTRAQYLAGDDPVLRAVGAIP